jgi:hypothetical protein
VLTREDGDESAGDHRILPLINTYACVNMSSGGFQKSYLPSNFAFFAAGAATSFSSPCGRLLGEWRVGREVEKYFTVVEVADISNLQ